MDSNEQFLNAIRQIAAERKLDFEDVLEVLKEAILVSFKANTVLPSSVHDRLSIEIDPESSKINVFLRKDVVEKVQDENSEIAVNIARKVNSKIKIGDTVLIDVTPQGDFGRIAAQHARQSILQKLSSLEKEKVLKQYSEKLGQVISVYVQKITKEGDVLCEVSKVRAVMPKEDRIDGEFYKLGSSIKVLLREIVNDENNKYMVVSRSDPKFLEALFKMEVPELENGTVEIVGIARDAGSRSKIAVKSNSQGIDPIGAFVGQRGVRINAVSTELKFGDYEEKIDIIEWSSDEETFIKNTIRSAKKVIITDSKTKKAIVVVPDDQVSVAIGKDGQNVRLSSILTGWSLEIKGESEVKKQDK